MIDQFEDPMIAATELIKITTFLSTERNLNHLLHMILTSARKIAHADAGRIYVLDHTKRYLYVEVCQNDSVPRLTKETQPIPLFINDKRNTSNACVYTTFYGKVINLPDVYHYTGFDFSDTHKADRLLRYRTTSILAVPLRSHEDITIGILELSNCLHQGTKQVIPFPTQLQGIVAAFASQAAVAIDTVQLISRNRQLIELLKHINQALEQENRQLRHHIERHNRFAEIIGQSPRMRQVYTFMEKILDSTATVLLRGETGTGKELVARAIHANSRRRNGEFVAQNCAALPEDLLESELFGYRRGAFTGATTDKKGLIEVASGGTLFLDEIGDMPLGMQAKLLRVLQEKEVRPLGSVKSSQVDVRVIAATHRDLQEKVASGEFREDLYYRICVFPIDIPPLRERKEDLPALLDHFLEMSCEQYKKDIAGYSPEALDCLLVYDYPGNIRELKNLVERAVLLCDDGSSIFPEHLPVHLMRQADASAIAVAARDGGAGSGAPDDDQDGLVVSVRHFEASRIEQTLKDHHWNQTKAAEALKVPRRTLIEKMRRYDIKR
jgi:sigma-54 dependent transcriptional regulator